MKNNYLLLFLLFSTYIFAQQSYYDDVNLNLSGLALKTELANKISNTHTNHLSYNDVREALKIIDLVPGQGTYLYLVYGFSNDICPNSTGNDNDHKRRNRSSFGGGSSCEWNREHTYPKSLGTPNLGTSGPGADAHMLRSCDVQRNSQRGSKLFRDSSGNSHIVNSDYWYPGDEWKGDMVRMMMYMYLRYGNQCLPKNVGYGNTVANDSNMIDLFLEWNADDPVSEYEENRNDYLENLSNTYGQGNRNPFIDNPYLATRIWDGPEAQDIWGIYMDISDNKLDNLISLSPNPTHNYLYINAADSNDIICASILSTSGQIIKKYTKIDDKPIDLHFLKSGLFFIKIKTTKGTLVKKVIKTG